MTPAVVHFIDTTAFGGAERALLHLLRATDRRRWRPVLFHHDAPGLQALFEAVTAAGIERRCVAPMRGPRGLADLPAFAHALRAEAPAVFHAHLNWPLACSGGILAAALNRVRAVVATVQLFSPLPPARTISWQRHLVTRAVGRYIGVSRAVARDIEQSLRVPCGRITVVPNGVPVAPVAAHGSCSAGGTGPARQHPTRHTVLTLARLEQQKGLTYLLEATARLPEVDLVIAGEGSERAALERHARTLGIAERVSFLGFRRDTASLLASADLFVLPSVLEGLPLAVLEAMAARLPVVATDAGGTGEVVRDGETGLLVPPGDVGALAIAIRRLLDDRTAADRLARAGQALVSQRFSAAATARSVMDVYDQLLEGRPA